MERTRARPLGNAAIALQRQAREALARAREHQNEGLRLLAHDKGLEAQVEFLQASIAMRDADDALREMRTVEE